MVNGYKDISKIKDELEQIKYFKNVYFKIRADLKERSKYIKTLNELLGVIVHDLTREGKNIINIYFSRYIKKEEQLHEGDLVQSKLWVLHILKTNLKEYELKIRKEYAGDKKYINEFFEIFKKMKKINSVIFSSFEKIKNYSLTLKIITYQMLKFDYNKNGELEKEFSYTDYKKTELGRVIHKLNTECYYNFFINFEKEIEEKEIRLENLEFVKQQKIAIKKDEEYKNSTNEFNRKSSTFNFILAMGVFGTLFYYFYNILKEFYIKETIHILILSGIFILIYVMLFFFVLHIANLKEEFKSFFEAYWHVVIFFTLLIIIFGYLLSKIPDESKDNELINLNISEINKNTEDILIVKENLNLTKNEVFELYNKTQSDFKELKSCMKTKLENNQTIERCLE
jgi:hypothetical protein